MKGAAKKPDQKAIEAQARQFMAQEPFSPDRTLEDLFGPAGSWTLKVGKYKLLLIPAVWQWWYYDRIHDSWEDTGYDMGDATFAVRKGELTPPKKKRQQARKESPAGLPSPAGKGFCTHCGSAIIAGNKFCTSCGNPLQ